MLHASVLRKKLDSVWVFFFKLVNVLYGFRTEQKLKQQMFQQMSLRPLEGMVAGCSIHMQYENTIERGRSEAK